MTTLASRLVGRRARALGRSEWPSTRDRGAVRPVRRPLHRERPARRARRGDEPGVANDRRALGRPRAACRGTGRTERLDRRRRRLEPAQVSSIALCPPTLPRSPRLLPVAQRPRSGRRGWTHGEGILWHTNERAKTLESVAKLIALSFERERLLVEQARLEGLQASDSFKTSLLRAVSARPLHAIDRDAPLALNSRPRACARPRAPRRSIWSSRKRPGCTGASGSARDGAPRSRADSLYSASLLLRQTSSAPRVRTSVGSPPSDASNPASIANAPTSTSTSLALEILVNLIENAHRASPANEPIELFAARHPDDESRVRLVVLDRGTGLRGREHASLRRGSFAGSLHRRRSAEGSRAGDREELRCSRTEGKRLPRAARKGGGVCAQIDLPAARLVGSRGARSPA